MNSVRDYEDEENKNFDENDGWTKVIPKRLKRELRNLSIEQSSQGSQFEGGKEKVSDY